MQPLESSKKQAVALLLGKLAQVVRCPPPDALFSQNVLNWNSAEVPGSRSVTAAPCTALFLAKSQ